MSDMTAFLTEAEVAALRAGYDRAAMVAGSAVSVRQHFTSAGPMVDALVAEIYDPEKMCPQARQRCILAILAQKPHALTLSVHVYWSLAEGLSLADIYRVLLLTGHYAGVDAFSVPAFVLKTQTLPLLKALAQEGGEAASTARVLGALVREFA